MTLSRPAGRFRTRALLLIAIAIGLLATLEGAAAGTAAAPAGPAPADPDAMGPAPPDVAPSRHSLFIYLFDGLAKAELPVARYPLHTAPNLMQLMAEGVVFMNANAPSPWTVPSVASLLTSLYPSAHLVQRGGDRLPASALTLAEVLKEHGYETALFTAHPLVGPLSGLDQGFDKVEEIPGPFGPEVPSGPAQTSRTLNEKVFAWLDRRSSADPVFVVVLSTDLMEPFGAPGPEGDYFIQKPEREWYAGIRRKLLAMRPGPLCLATAGDLERLKVDPDRFAKAARALYDGAILYNDRRLQELRKGLEKRDLWGRMLFLVTSTHGEEFGERGVFGHGSSLYAPAIQIPLVFSYPPVFDGPRQSSRALDLVEVYPTLLTYLGLPVPPTVNGIFRNVDPLNRIPPYNARPASSETSPMGELPTGRSQMVTETGWKLIANLEAPRGQKRPGREFFRGPDPKGWEQRNLLMVQPKLAAEKGEVLEAWLEDARSLRLAPDSASPSPSPRLREVLFSLGYLQGWDAALAPANPSREGKKATTKTREGGDRKGKGDKP